MSFRMAKSRLEIDKVGDMGRPTGATVLILWECPGISDILASNA